MLQPPFQQTPQASRHRVHARDKEVTGGRDQSGRVFISSTVCGPYSDVRSRERARLPTPSYEAVGSLPLGGAPTPHAAGFLSSVLEKVSVEFPFYRNLNGGSKAEVKCPSHLDDECKSQGSIQTTHLHRACQSLASLWGIEPAGTPARQVGAPRADKKTIPGQPRANLRS